MYKRAALSFFTLSVIFGILMVNLFAVNIRVQTAPSSETGNKRSLTLSSSRGMIYDCNMKRLVNNSSKNITVLLPTANALNKIFPYVSLGERERLYQNMSAGKVSSISLPQEFSEQDIKTAVIAERYGENHFAHLIGHLDENGSGAMGLEKAYDNFLSQQKGTLKAVWSADALGRILYGQEILFESDRYLSPAGIQLTVDLEIQKIAENALRKYQIECGAAVIMDAETAEILASVSVPDFDPNNLGEAVKNENSPFLNRAAAPYSVGSVFKPFVAACAIESNIEISHSCTGGIQIGSTYFGCYSRTAHGKVDLRAAMNSSCNTYFIALGQKAGSEKILSLCGSVGLGKSAELADNFYLKSGYLPTDDDIASPQDLANLSFGQGKLMASPIQMAAAYACFANGGLYRPPTLMKSIIDMNGEAVQKVILPESRRVLNKSTADKIDSLLRSVVTDGNGNKAFSHITDGRGKTATAQSGWYREGREVSHTWFCGYFTAGSKKIVAAIIKEDGISGAADCAPVFKDISEQITRYMSA